MARYRKNPDHTRVRVNLTLDPKIYELAQELAYAEGVSVSELVNRLLAASTKGEDVARIERIREAGKAAEAAAKKAAKEVMDQWLSE